MSLFAVDPRSGVSLDLSWECLGKHILLLFAMDLFSGASSTYLGNVWVSPLSGAPLDLSWACLGEQIFVLVAVDPLSGASLDLS